MTEQEKIILRLMYDLQTELLRNQGQQIRGLRLAIESVERQQEILGKLMKATSELIGIQ